MGRRNDTMSLGMGTALENDDNHGWDLGIHMVVDRAMVNGNGIGIR